MLDHAFSNVWSSLWSNRQLIKNPHSDSVMGRLLLTLVWDANSTVCVIRLIFTFCLLMHNLLHPVDYAIQITLLKRHLVSEVYILREILVILMVWKPFQCYMVWENQSNVERLFECLFRKPDLNTWKTISVLTSLFKNWEQYQYWGVTIRILSSWSEKPLMVSIRKSQ